MSVSKPSKSKYKNVITDQYRSKLERVCAELLVSNDLKFEYEPWEVVLINPFEFPLVSYERIGKEFKPQRSKIRKTSYKPDFVGKNWIIETKGMRTADFLIKWKLFKRHLVDIGYEGMLFMPTNKKEIIKVIETIKENV